MSSSFLEHGVFIENLKEDFAAAAPQAQKSVEMAFARWKEKKASM
jgi:hypothetical protein